MKKKKLNKCSSLGYTGIVKVSIEKNHRIIKAATYKNSGTENLFSFFAHCLAGEWNIAQGLIPKKIKLFNKTALTDVESANNRATNFIYFNSKPDVKNEKCTYHFLIPSNLIIGNEVKQVMLYNETNRELATFVFDNPIEIDPNSNFNLIIDWTLDISNKENETIAVPAGSDEVDETNELNEIVGGTE